MLKILVILILLYFIFSYPMKASRVHPQPVSNVGEDPYEILGVHRQSSADDIKAAYRDLSKKNHPDLVTHMSDDFKKLAESKLQKINWAYQEIRKMRGF